MNLHKSTWTDGFEIVDFEGMQKKNEACLKEMKALTERYEESVLEETATDDADKFLVANVGKQDAKKRLAAGAEASVADNVSQALGICLESVAF